MGAHRQAVRLQYKIIVSQLVQGRVSNALDHPAAEAEPQWSDQLSVIGSSYFMMQTSVLF